MLSASDYYGTLGIDRSATDDEIKRAYRVQALKHHPEINPGTQAQARFALVAEAYDVLSDSKRRAVYDQYGEDGLKNGVPLKQGSQVVLVGGYQFHGRPEESFAKFFGGNNPFSELLSYDGEKFGDAFGGLNGMSSKQESGHGNTVVDGPKQDPPIERDLVLTLEELYQGSKKKIRITHKVLKEDRTTTSVQEKYLTIDVKKGWKANTRIVFPKEGDQGPNNIPADLVFVVKEASHPIFKRNGNDLIYKIKLSLLQALAGTVINVSTLDGRSLSIPIYEVVHPNFTKIVPGEGMPLSKSPETKGDLRLEFEIEFPTYFSDKQKALLREAFHSS